jgi:hypothetical protein
MKNSTVVLISFCVSLAVAGLIGLGYFICNCDKSQPTGSFTAQDLQEYGDYSEKIGAEKMRDAIKALNTDTSARACQKVKLPELSSQKYDTVTITWYGDNKVNKHYRIYKKGRLVKILGDEI